MWIDDSSPAFSGSSSGKFVGLDLLAPLYLGGVPGGRGVGGAAEKDTGLENGFVGGLRLQ